jgi:DNA repair protein RecO (recombination protein O)
LSRFVEDLAIVLRSQPFQERDRLVTLLTENHGRISGIAKGAIHSRRFGGTLDLFASSQVRWKETQGELVRVEEANLRRDFLKLRERLENISAAGHFTDLLLRLTEERQPARELFLLLAHYLVLLEAHPATFEIVRSFEIKLLERLGWAPVLEECVNCGAAFFGEELPPEQSYVSLAVERGGFLCHACSSPQGRHFPLASVLWMIQARETQIQHTPSLNFPLDPMLEATAALQHFLRWHCPGLGNYHFRAHSMLETFLLEKRAPGDALPSAPIILGEAEEIHEMDRIRSSGGGFPLP